MKTLIVCTVACSLLWTSVARPRTGRLTLSDSAEFEHHNHIDGPGTYHFNYDIEEPGVVQFRTEERTANGTVTGSYGFVSPEGSVHVVHYRADHLGYRARVEDSRLEDAAGAHPSPEMQHALRTMQNYDLDRHRHDQRVRPVDKPGDNQRRDGDYQKLLDVDWLL